MKRDEVIEEAEQRLADARRQRDAHAARRPAAEAAREQAALGMVQHAAPHIFIGHVEKVYGHYVVAAEGYDLAVTVCERNLKAAIDGLPARDAKRKEAAKLERAAADAELFASQSEETARAERERIAKLRAEAAALSKAASTPMHKVRGDSV